MADYIFTALCGNALIRLFHFKAYSVFIQMNCVLFKIKRAYGTPQEIVIIIFG